MVKLWTGEIFYLSHCILLSKFANVINRTCNSGIVFGQTVFNFSRHFRWMTLVFVQTLHVPVTNDTFESIIIADRIVGKLILQKGVDKSNYCFKKCYWFYLLFLTKIIL